MLETEESGRKVNIATLHIKVLEHFQQNIHVSDKLVSFLSIA